MAVIAKLAATDRQIFCRKPRHNKLGVPVRNRTLLVVRPVHCYNARHRMADWKQDLSLASAAHAPAGYPAAQRSTLYEKTQDAMVAFELARHFETAGLPADAGKWYVSAAERFRRADWKTKALESAVRLGYEIPAGSLEAALAPKKPQQAANRAVMPLAPHRIHQKKINPTPRSPFIPRGSPCRSPDCPSRKTPKCSNRWSL